jgi:hypothetical protein
MSINNLIIETLKSNVPDIEEHLNGSKPIDLQRLKYLKSSITSHLSNNFPIEVKKLLQELQSTIEKLLQELQNPEQDTQVIQDSIRKLHSWFAKYPENKVDGEFSNIIEQTRKVLFNKIGRNNMDSNKKVIQDLEKIMSGGTYAGGNDLGKGIIFTIIFMVIVIQIYILTNNTVDIKLRWGIRIVFFTEFIILFGVAKSYYKQKQRIDSRGVNVIQPGEADISIFSDESVNRNINYIILPEEKTIPAFSEEFLKTKDVNYIIQQIVSNLIRGVPHVIKIINNSFDMIQHEKITNIVNQLYKFTSILYQPQHIKNTIIMACLPPFPEKNIGRNEIQIEAWHDIKKENDDFETTIKKIDTYYNTYINNQTYKDAYTNLTEQLANQTISYKEKKVFIDNFLELYPNGNKNRLGRGLPDPAQNYNEYINKIKEFYSNVQKLLVIITTIQEDKDFSDFITRDGDKITANVYINPNNIMILYNLWFVLTDLMNFYYSQIGTIYVDSLIIFLQSQVGLLLNYYSDSDNFVNSFILKIVKILNKYQMAYLEFNLEVGKLNDEYLSIVNAFPGYAWPGNITPLPNINNNPIIHPFFGNPFNFIVFRKLFNDWHKFNAIEKNIINNFLIHVYYFTIPFILLEDPTPAAPTPTPAAPTPTPAAHADELFPEYNKLNQNYDPTLLSSDNNQLLLNQIQIAQNSNNNAVASEKTIELNEINNGLQVITQKIISPTNNLWAFTNRINNMILNIIEIFNQQTYLVDISNFWETITTTSPRLIELFNIDLRSKNFVIYNKSHARLLIVDPKYPDHPVLIFTDDYDANNLYHHWFLDTSKIHSKLYNVGTRHAMYVNWSGVPGFKTGHAYMGNDNVSASQIRKFEIKFLKTETTVARSQFKPDENPEEKHDENPEEKHDENPEEKHDEKEGEFDLNETINVVNLIAYDKQINDMDAWDLYVGKSTVLPIGEWIESIKHIYGNSERSKLTQWIVTEKSLVKDTMPKYDTVVHEVPSAPPEETRSWYNPTKFFWGGAVGGSILCDYSNNSIIVGLIIVIILLGLVFLYQFIKSCPSIKKNYECVDLCDFYE